MSDRENHVQIPDSPSDETVTHPMSNDWPAFNDGRARSRDELQHFSDEQGVEIGLTCREPMRADFPGPNVRPGF